MELDHTTPLCPVMSIRKEFFLPMWPGSRQHFALQDRPSSVNEPVNLQNHPEFAHCFRSILWCELNHWAIGVISYITIHIEHHILKTVNDINYV